MHCSVSGLSRVRAAAYRDPTRLILFAQIHNDLRPIFMARSQRFEIFCRWLIRTVIQCYSNVRYSIFIFAT